MRLLFTPITAALSKSAEWTRRRIIEGRQLFSTPLFNERVAEGGHLPFDEALEVVRQGSVFTCKPQPALYRFGFVWNNKVVIADSIIDRNHSDDGKVFLITCYDRDKPLDDGAVHRLPVRKLIAPDKVVDRIVDAGAPTLGTVKDTGARIAALTKPRARKIEDMALGNRAKLEEVRARLSLEIAKLEELLAAMRMDLADVHGQLGGQR